MSIRGTPEGPRPDKTQEAIEAAKEKAKQVREAEKIMYTGVQSVLQMMYAWAEQLEKQVAESKSASTSPETKPAAELPASQPLAKVDAKSDGFQKKMDAMNLITSLAKLGKELEVMGLFTKGIASLNFNQDPQKVSDQVREKFKAIFAAVDAFKNNQGEFEELAKLFPGLAEEKERTAQGFEELFSKTGSLPQLLTLGGQLEALSKGKAPTLAASAELAKLLQLIKKQADVCSTSMNAATGPFKKTKGGLAAMANTLAGVVSPASTTAPPKSSDGGGLSLWGLAEELLLGKMMPELDQGMFFFSAIIGIENALERMCGPMMSGIGAATYKLGGSKNAATQLKKLLSELKKLTGAKKKAESMEKYLSEQEKKLISKYGTNTKKWPSNLRSAAKDISALKSQMKSLSQQMKNVDSMIPKLQNLLEKTPNGHDYKYLSRRKTVGGGDVKTPGGGYDYQIKKAYQNIASKWNQDFVNLRNAAVGLGGVIEGQSQTTTAFLRVEQTRMQMLYSTTTQIIQLLYDIVKAIAQNTKGG